MGCRFCVICQVCCLNPAVGKAENSCLVFLRVSVLTLSGDESPEPSQTSHLPDVHLCLLQVKAVPLESVLPQLHP